MSPDQPQSVPQRTVRRPTRSHRPARCRCCQRLSPRAGYSTRSTRRVSGRLRYERGTCSSSVGAIGRWIMSRPITDQICADPAIDAVIIATPNFTHVPQAIAAAPARQARHVREALGFACRRSARRCTARRKQADVVHMTAFTYRFAPSMRYLKHCLVTGALGTPRHFRSQRFLDLPETSWGWRQYKDKAGAGDLFDMTIHRIDFAMDLLGPIERICGAVARFAPRTSTADGQPCAVGSG